MNDFSSSSFIRTDTGRVDSVEWVSPSAGTSQDNKASFHVSSSLFDHDLNLQDLRIFFVSLIWTRDFFTRTIVRVGRYLSHCSCKAVANSWFLCKQDVISNKIPLKIKMDCLKLKLEIVEALSVSPPANKSIFTDDEDNSVVVPLAKRSKRYNPPAIHVLAFILAIPG
ncbi:uncharacterized protein TNCV_2976071 [Trichonephila clavipes]|nr:uncharacterized protein TNCV_2976071 [Trichonephila clavipes]